MASTSSTFSTSTVAETRVTLTDGKLHLEAFVYLRSGPPKKTRVYWACRKLRSGECKAKAITLITTDCDEVIVYKGRQESRHTHALNREAIAADPLAQTLMRKANDNPQQPPAQLLCTELGGGPDPVLS